MNKFTELMKLMETEEPEPADVIVWLQGDGLDRMETVIQLCNDGFARYIILSGNNINTHHDDFVSLGVMAEHLIDFCLYHYSTSSSGIFLDSTAENTYEHPAGVLKITREFGWKRLLLVTSLYHQPRAFLAFLPHLAPDEMIINQPWKGVSFREKHNKGRLLAPFEQEANKVTQGVEMGVLATIEEGIAYITNRLNGEQK